MLPIIPATVIGSWSFPGWYAKFCEDAARHPELFGSDDREEALRDAVRLAIDDQLRAGADIITDGEMQRVDFNLGFYDYLEGIKPLPPSRLLGPPAHDQRSRYRLRRAACGAARAGLGRGISAAARRLHRRAGQGARARPVHAGRLPARRRGLPRPREITEALMPIVNREMKDAGRGRRRFHPARRAELRVPSRISPEQFLDTDRPHGRRRERQDQHAHVLRQLSRPGGRLAQLSPLFPHLARAAVQQLALEFASREMAEIELLKQIPAPMEVAVGLVDVKNTWIEPPELVAQRLRQTLRYIEPERVHVTPDCGFSQTAGYVAAAEAGEHGGGREDGAAGAAAVSVTELTPITH